MGTAEVNTQDGNTFDPNSILSFRTDRFSFVPSIHPDKEKIEAAFEDNPELANQYRGLSALGSLLHAADESAPFRDAYAKDPYAAVERYGYLLDDNRQCEFHLSISEAGIDEFFRES